jgi:hypothetical protein
MFSVSFVFCCCFFFVAFVVFIVFCLFFLFLLFLVFLVVFFGVLRFATSRHTWEECSGRPCRDACQRMPSSESDPVEETK